LELCGCERVVLSEFKRSVDYINLKCNSCLLKIFLYEDLKEEEIKENDLVIIFSNINSLKNIQNQLRCKRVFISKGSIFLNKIKNGLILPSNNKKILLITKISDSLKRTRKGFLNCFINNPE
ncbi:MAG: hypothetical protein ABDH49_09285, partial [Candidatus Hydrothermales bacterium]